MKRVVYAVVVAFGCTVAASAQSGMGADKMAQDKMAKGSDKEVMVTGCVAESGGHYMLNNAMMMDHAMPGMTPGAAPAAPAAGAPMAATAPMAYMLTGGTLKPHVGHKVEVTGMMKPMAGDDMAKGKMGKDSMAKDDMMMKDAKGMAGTLAVKNLKMIAATCS